MGKVHRTGNVKGRSDKDGRRRSSQHWLGSVEKQPRQSFSTLIKRFSWKGEIGVVTWHNILSEDLEWHSEGSVLVWRVRSMNVPTVLFPKASERQGILIIFSSSCLNLELSYVVHVKWICSVKAQIYLHNVLLDTSLFSAHLWCHWKNTLGESHFHRELSIVQTDLLFFNHKWIILLFTKCDCVLKAHAPKCILD